MIWFLVVLAVINGELVRIHEPVDNFHHCILAQRAMLDMMEDTPITWAAWCKSEPEERKT